MLLLFFVFQNIYQTGLLQDSLDDIGFLDHSTEVGFLFRIQRVPEMTPTVFHHYFHNNWKFWGHNFYSITVNTDAINQSIYLQKAGCQWDNSPSSWPPMIINTILNHNHKNKKADEMTRTVQFSLMNVEFADFVRVFYRLCWKLHQVYQQKAAIKLKSTSWKVTSK